MSTTVYPTGLTARSDYNARGYLESLTDTASNSMLERYRAMNAYGQVTRETYANGVSTVRAFDPNSGRLTGIDTVKDSTTLQDTDYAWQSNGILKSRISHRGGMSAKTETFTYDALDRLRSAVTDLTGNAITKSPPGRWRSPAGVLTLGVYTGYTHSHSNGRSETCA